MKYVILADSQKFRGQKVALADRSRYRSQWWTEHIGRAKTFDTLQSAESVCVKLKFNNPTVCRLDTASARIKKAIIRDTALGHLLDEKNWAFQDVSEFGEEQGWGAKGW